jgi:hypothetical protein
MYLTRNHQDSTGWFLFPFLFIAQRKREIEEKKTAFDLLLQASFSLFSGVTLSSDAVGHNQGLGEDHMWTASYLMHLMQRGQGTVFLSPSPPTSNFETCDGK